MWRFTFEIKFIDADELKNGKYSVMKLDRVQSNFGGKVRNKLYSLAASYLHFRLCSARNCLSVSLSAFTVGRETEFWLNAIPFTSALFHFLFAALEQLGNCAQL